MRQQLSVVAALAALTALALPARAEFPASSGEPAEQEVAAPTFANDPIRSLWAGLSQTDNTCEGTFDYHPGGGMRIFACHMASRLSYAKLRALSGVEVFLDGPHKGKQLRLDAKRSFGRYNPAFVRWAIAHLIPAADDAAFRVATQPLYDRFVKPLATAYYLTWRKAQVEPRCFEREVERYTRFLAGRDDAEMPYERYFFFMNKHFCENPDGGFEFFHRRGFDEDTNGNVIKTAAAWWMRRTIDGTAKDWARGLTKLIRTYDMGLLQGRARQAPRPGKD